MQYLASAPTKVATGSAESFRRTVVTKMLVINHSGFLLGSSYKPKSIWLKISIMIINLEKRDNIGNDSMSYIYDS